MPRPAKFDRELLLERAMHLFWQQGYTQTSLKQLEATLGLTPPSIYHAFQSKENLFTLVLDYYLQSVVETRIRQYLDKTANPLDDLQEFLTSAIASGSSEHPGCLLTNTTTELGQTLPNIAAKTHQGLLHIQEAFHGELSRAVTLGFLQDVDIDALAISLLVSYQGLLTLARSPASSERLEAMVQSVMSVTFPNPFKSYYSDRYNTE